MSQKLPIPDRRYELLKDIITPTTYVRAGTTKTGSEWLTAGYVTDLRRCPDQHWFADVTVDPDAPATADTQLRSMCKATLAKHGLHSMTFLDAAVQCVKTDRAHRLANLPAL